MQVQEQSAAYFLAFQRGTNQVIGEHEKLLNPTVQTGLTQKIAFEGVGLHCERGFRI